MPKYFYCYHLFRYKKFFKEHLINNFKQCLEDKLHRLEARYHPNLITDENFNIIPIEEELFIIQDSLNEIRKIDKDFSFGITIEMISMKSEKTENIMNLSFEIKKKCSEIICGMDITGDEDNFKTFYELKDTMIKIENLKKE